MSVIRYFKALRKCSVAAFNANQITKHEQTWLVDAVREEEAAWAALPRWIRRLMSKYA